MNNPEDVIKEARADARQDFRDGKVNSNSHTPGCLAYRWYNIEFRSQVDKAKQGVSA